ncbi:MAG: terminase large subunit [Beijerinckiaceae bacterium]
MPRSASLAAGKIRAKKGEPNRDAVRRAAFSHLPRADFDGELVPDYVAMAEGYADAVLDGRIAENFFVLKACERYKRMRAKADKTRGEYYWSPVYVLEVCSFVESCPQVEGGDDDATIVLDPCQIFILANIFGFRTWSGSKSVRWFTEALLDGPRKFGKTSLLSAVDLYIFLHEDEKGSQILLGASSRAQAAKVYGPIRKILNAEPELVEMHGLRVTSKETRRPDGGFIAMVSSLGKKEDGAIPHVIHIDELHAVSSDLYEVFASAMGARANELFLQSTTAGVRASGPGYDQRKRLERVLLGKEKAPRFFGIIWTIDKDDLKDPLRWECLVKAHPMIGITIKEDALRNEMERARFSPRAFGEFMPKRLNVYARGASGALSLEEMEACGDASLKIADLAGKPCWIGVDLSSHDDQTAVTVLFEVGDCLVVFCRHFLPRESPSFQNEAVADSLFEWVEQQWIVVNEGPITDFDAVQAYIEELCEFLDVQAVVFDRAHSIQIAGALAKKGIPAGIIQATSVEMSEPTKDIVIRARNKLLKHDGNPVLNWNGANVCLTPGDLWRPIKDKTVPHLKIDGFSALVHANVARLGRVKAKTDEDEAPVEPQIRIL